MRDKENYKKWYKEHYNKNKDRLRKASLDNYYKNPEIKKAKHREWAKNNKDYCNEYRNNWRHNNDSWKLVNRLRSRVWHVLNDKNAEKSDYTLELLSCSLEILENHLQNTAINNGYNTFNINSYDGKEYHIDHIIPCDAFNLKCSYHQKLCFNLNNLQILSAKENLTKSNKY